jgi:hypothetical protein
MKLRKQERSAKRQPVLELDGFYCFDVDISTTLFEREKG